MPGLPLPHPLAAPVIVAQILVHHLQSLLHSDHPLVTLLYPVTLLLVVVLVVVVVVVLISPLLPVVLQVVLVVQTSRVEAVPVTLEQ